MTKQDDRKQVQVRIDDGLYRKFKKACIDRKLTVRDAVESFMTHFINRNESAIEKGKGDR